MTERTAGRMSIRESLGSGNDIKTIQATLTIDYNGIANNSLDNLCYEDMLDLEYLIKRTLGRLE